MFVKRLLVFLAIVIFTPLVLAAYFFWPIAPAPIPDEVLREADAAWERHMLNREGAYYILGDEYHPSFSDRAEQYANQINGTWSTSTIIVKAELAKEGNYMRMRGGPMDIIKGDTINYVLYGKEVGQHYMPFRGAWNDVYHFSHADYYLLRENTGTNETEIIRTWPDKPNAYGQLFFDEETNMLTVELCGIGVAELIVTDIHNPQLPENRALICTSSSNKTAL